MERNSKKIAMLMAGIEAILAIFMILIVKVIAPVCTGMLETTAGKQVHMKCYYTSVAIMILGVLLLVNAMICFVTNQTMACGMMTVAIGLCAIVFLSDTMGIGICANPDMACNVTAPYVKLCGTLQIVVGAISAFLGVKKAK